LARLTTPAAIAAALLAFVPWGTVSVRTLGMWSPGLDFKGTEIDSGLGLGLAAGWIVVILAVAAIFSGGRSTAIAVALLLYTAYSALTLAHHTIHITGSATGHHVSDLVGERVSLAWGSVAEVIAAIVVLGGAISSRSAAGEPASRGRLSSRSLPKPPAR
jgi:hypothetical protein